MPVGARCIRGLALAVAVVSVRGAAQEPPRIALTVAPRAGGVEAIVAVRNALTVQPFDELLRSGFPARLHVRAELWTVGRWFDNVADATEWDVIVRYDVLTGRYEVARITRDRITPLGSHATFAEARLATEVPHAPVLVAPSARTAYVAVTVEVQTVALGDLDEVRRWLRGEAQPMLQGRRNPGTALGRGLRTVVSRLLGGTVRYLEARSAEFGT